MNEELSVVPYVHNGEVPFRPYVCHTCKMSITDPTMHGWVYSGYDEAAMKTKLTPCPTCSNTAISQRKHALIDRLLGQSHIPLRMADWSFTTVPADVDLEAKQRAIFFSNAQAPKNAMYFYGLPGGGKTGLAICIIQAVMRRGEDAVFIRSLDLMDRLRESIRQHSSNQRQEQNDGDELLALVKSVKWLALDDLATEKPTEYVLQELKTIVEKRMDNNLYTIFTSNFSLKQLADYWRPEGVPKDGFYPGRRIIDRIAEYVEGVPVKGRNLRQVVSIRGER